jgi:hypothetical protein
VTLTRQAKFGLWVAAAVLTGAMAFLVGSALKPGAEPTYLFDTQAPAYGEPSSIAATSPGGFTGFGETAGSGDRVVVSGRVTDLTDSSITLEGSLGQTTLLTFRDSPRVYSLEAATSDLLRPGVTVALRLNEAGDAVEGVLVLSQP